MDENVRLQAVLNMVVNSSTLMMAAMTSGLSGAMGEVAAVMSEAVAGALGGAEAGKRSGSEVRGEVADNISSHEVEELSKCLNDMTAQISQKVSAFTPEDMAGFMEDIKHESYDRAIEAINKADFGLPRITERLDANILLKYLKISDPRFDEIMQLVFSAQPPRVFAAGAPAETIIADDEPEALPAPAAPEVIEEFPARYEFPPKFTSTISIPCDDEIMLRWSSTHKGEIEDYGICVESGGSKTSTPSGGMNFYPEDGRIIIKMTNLEAFPMTVEIFMEKRPAGE